MEDQIFLFDYNDKMWFDPGDLCWHCVLVKGETSRDGILVEAEGYSYARYAAFAPDCGRRGCGMSLSTMNTQQKRRSKRKLEKE